MTALSKYARLESGGIWRASAEAQRRDVVVAFGDATLVIADVAGRPLTHWSLPAVQRLNPAEMPAIFSPDPDEDELLEVDDETMVDAIETVRRSLARSRPRPGRLRWLGMGLSVSAVVALMLFWLPDAITRQTLSVVPASKRIEIGATLLGHVQVLAGASCRTEQGRTALTRLETRVLGPGFAGQIVVLPSGLAQALYLPGGIIALNRTVVEDPEDPAVTAGYVIAATTTVRVEDPLEPLLRQAGLRATLTLLTTGDLPQEVLRRYAETVLAENPPQPPTEELLASFAAAQVPTTPYAFDLDLTGESVLDLIEADPMADRFVPEILTDGDWVALQGICGA